MADIATIWDPIDGIGDWSISVGRLNLITDEAGNSLSDGAGGVLLGASPAFTPGTGLQADMDLQTACLISLFTDAAADPDDVIPDGSDDPRGWWAGPIGSKLWLRARSKATLALPALIKNDIETALRWLVDDGIAALTDVSVSFLNGHTIVAVVTIHRSNGTTRSLRFSRLWETL